MKLHWSARVTDGMAWPRVAVVGCGYWGKNLVRNMSELGVLAALVDHSAARLAELTAKHGGRAATFEEVLADASIGAVVIATPGPSHHALASAALAAGKHVYVEKPIAMTGADVEDLIATGDGAGRTLMVGHILRYHPAFARLQALVAEGAIGRLRHVVSTRFNLGKILTDEDVLWSLGPHDLSMVTALLGAEPVRVTCAGDAFLRPGVTDLCNLRLTYAEGTSAEIRLSWMSPFKEHKLIVWGETGVLIFDDTRPWEEKLTLRRIGLDWANPAVTPDPGTTEPLPLPPGEPLKAECRHFLDACANGTRPTTDGREGLAVTRLLERASASILAHGAPR